MMMPLKDYLFYWMAEANKSCVWKFASENDPEPNIGLETRGSQWSEVCSGYFAMRNPLSN
eukprot:5413840-Amphidinium_carterae.1